MVIKGGSRGSGSQLAGHLLRADTNERVEVVELAGVTAATLPAALSEMMAVAAGTRCTKPLYHASLNTGPGERLTPAQKRHAIAALERRLGLTSHPRVVVEHRKAGRDHLHIVWSRIDPETMKAVHDGFNYRAHEEVARQLEREFGHWHIQGAHVERKGRPRPARTPPTAEVQQAARTNTDPAVIMAEITRLWQAADSGKAFAAALHEAGYMLAQGDKRGFCLVDPAGGVHSLARRIAGVGTKEVKARLAEIDLTSLPTVAQARDQLRQRQAASPALQKDPAPPSTSCGGVPGGAGVPSSKMPPLSLQQGATATNPNVAAGNTAREGIAATQTPEKRPESGGRSLSGNDGPVLEGKRGICSETLYYVVIRPAGEDPYFGMRQTDPPSRGTLGRVAGQMLGILSSLFGGGRPCSGAMPPSSKWAGITAPAVSSEIVGKGGIVPSSCRLAVPKMPPKGRATERPFGRLMGSALGVPQEVIAWAVEARKKLIAYSEATGEYVVPELEHLSRIILGAYLDQGLTVTGKQRQTPGPL